ncbi:hypothetical protein [Streptomyces genisteinicus]|uniref:Uncharacterized protein n=1 Tax=Streptomyces genisteinicus TaxID=2768068 RepID=A0A7H0I024_9ACTN|nr:hypothetical protein [Streptomyces genisteinicus]QNP66140.1 hypothetical protein IAG43_26580 [Streptomyces genisteinicus]
MNLADAKRQFQGIVDRYGGGPVTDPAERAAALAELTEAHRSAMRQIDRYTAERRGRRPPGLAVNTRNGLVGKLDELFSSAKAELGLG